MREGITRQLHRFAAEVTRGLGIPKACAGIIEVAALHRRRLSFAEIAVRVRISERSLRDHLGILVRKGILLREVAITRSRRLAYSYTMAPLGDVLRMVRGELALKLERLQRLSAEVRAKHRSVAGGSGQ